jgi:hypothetical protein
MQSHAAQEQAPVGICGVPACARENAAGGKFRIRRVWLAQTEFEKKIKKTGKLIPMKFFDENS